MRSSLVQRTVFALAVGAACCIPGERDAQAFDTFWHSAATGAMGRQYGFTQDSLNVVQFGNFAGPDFFGPFYDSALPKLGIQQFMEAHQTETMPVRKMATFMHFDNLHKKITANWQFDYLFVRLLENTQAEILKIFGDGNLNEGTKKIAILETLGIALHMVQDFYSHSDWIHQDFELLGIPLVKTTWGPERAPTWFELRAMLGDPQWCFSYVIHSGIYPADSNVAGSNFTHSRMNHDNSQLVYTETENETPNGGEPRISQVQHHSEGSKPADLVGPAEHQLFAINTAAGASIEWVDMLEKLYPGVTAAIDYAKAWDLKAFNPAMLNDLTNGLDVALFASCAASKWDGFDPPPGRKIPCSAAMTPGYGFNLLAHGLAGFFNEFWGDILKLNLVEHLTRGYGDQGGDYSFDLEYVNHTFGYGGCTQAAVAAKEALRRRSGHRSQPPAPPTPAVPPQSQAEAETAAAAVRFGLLARPGVSPGPGNGNGNGNGPGGGACVQDGQPGCTRTTDCCNAGAGVTCVNQLCKTR